MLIRERSFRWWPTKTLSIGIGGYRVHFDSLDKKSCILIFMFYDIFYLNTSLEVDLSYRNSKFTLGFKF